METNVKIHEVAAGRRLAGFLAERKRKAVDNLKDQAIMPEKMRNAVMTYQRNLAYVA